MNSPLPPGALAAVTLDDKYTLAKGRVYMSGTQALVRLPMLQKARDLAAGLDTAGYISGYRGSPLGALDLALWKAKKHLSENSIVFQPGVNEELAATAVWGSQQTGLWPSATRDGVFGMWYGKGPGVDRAGDVLKHANSAGTSPHGGVLLLAGDDHAAKSSSVAHQSEHALIAAGIPVLYPSSVQEYIDFGLHGWAMSRFSGLWVGMKCVTDVVESSASVDIDTDRVTIVTPTDCAMPADGVGIRWPDPPLAQEARLFDYKWYAALAYVRANKLNRIVIDSPTARFGIMTAGKAYLDVRQALADLGLDDAGCAAAGIRLMKVGCVWPLDAHDARAFATGLEEILVVEEKRQILEYALKEELYNWRDDVRPRVYGKFDERDNLGGEWSVPQGSRALAGIGCHYMAMWMDRSTETFSQMGGEGVTWLGQMHFTTDKHVFVNLGDGTYFHSGHLAIRAAIAAKANVTYKILFNDAVAMTGGQPVDGVLSVPQIAHQMAAEGAAGIVIVTDEPEKYTRDVVLPAGVAVHHRRELDALQLKLRDTRGTTVLIYDQTCATEKRRRRKRGSAPDPARRAFVNDAVCEGCGDCSVQSNCLSVEPLATPLGTKRRINQSSCNKDFSCVNGFCPSFITAEGAQVRKPAVARAAALPDFAALPLPASAQLAASGAYGILVTGVGGTGVVTIGGLLGMAAHLEHKGVAVLDMAGLAQKGGAVVSHIQIAASPDQIHATRVAMGEAALVIGCDAIVSSSADVLSKTRRGRTRAIINSAATPTAAFIKDRDWTFPLAGAESALREQVGDECEFIDANERALALLGDTIYANPLLLGYAWQKGWLPLGLGSLVRAIELNAVAVDKNKLAFNWGRHLAHHGVTLPPAAPKPIVLHMPESLDSVVAQRVALLTAFQDARYAARYQAVVALVRERERAAGDAMRTPFTTAVARNLARLMAYKDEYEVARLYAEPVFLDKLRSQFEGEPGRDYKLRFHLAPPLLAKRDGRGRLVKQAFGAWMLPAFRLLARCKRLRGTPFDVFGYSGERRQERAMIDSYIQMVEGVSLALAPENLAIAVRLASLPDTVRGFGHVKDAAIGGMEKQRAQLLAQFQTTRQQGAAA